jgi:hypothetical protein
VVPCTGLFYFTGKISTRGDGARPSYEIYKRLLKTYYNHKQKIITSKCSFQSRVYFRQRNNNPINFFLGITYYISDHPFGYRLNNGWNSWVSSEQYYNWSQRFGWVGPALSIDNSKKKHAVYVIAMSISHLLCLDPYSPVTVLAVSSDGTLCASADTAGSIQVFDVQNTKVRGWIYCRITCTPCERGAYYIVLYLESNKRVREFNFLVPCKHLYMLFWSLPSSVASRLLKPWVIKLSMLKSTNFDYFFQHHCTLPRFSRQITAMAFQPETNILVLVNTDKEVKFKSWNRLI